MAAAGAAAAGASAAEAAAAAEHAASNLAAAAPPLLRAAVHLRHAALTQAHESHELAQAAVATPGATPRATSALGLASLGLASRSALASRSSSLVAAVAVAQRQLSLRGCQLRGPLLLVHADSTLLRLVKDRHAARGLALPLAALGVYAAARATARREGGARRRHSHAVALGLRQLPSRRQCSRQRSRQHAVAHSRALRRLRHRLQ